MNALGMIEVYGYLTAVAALDTALKAADVHLVDVVKVKGGLVTVIITGDVGAVKAAIEASVSEAERVGKLISQHVIPRPVDSIDTLFGIKKEAQTNAKIEEVTNEVNPAKEEVDKVEVPVQEEKPAQPQKQNPTITAKSMQEMTVEKLRQLARQLKITNLTRNEIKYANKGQLIQSISSFLEQER